MIPLENENEVIAAARAGDAGAFRALVNHYAKELYGLCYSLSGNAADAEDISQDVFVKVLKAIRVFDGRSKFSTWLHQLAVNRWIDVSRRRKLLLFFSIDAQDDEGMEEPLPKNEFPDTEPLPEEIAASREVQEAVAGSLKGLSDDQRTAIVLKYQEGMSLEQIARVCKAPVGTVSARISRGIIEMKKKLKKYEVNKK